MKDYCDLTRDERLDDDRYECHVHVGCDQACKALLDPQTRGEVQAALDHWRSHRYLHGCSHAC